MCRCIEPSVKQQHLSFVVKSLLPSAKKFAVRLRRLCKQGIGKSEIKSTLIHVYKYKDTMSVRIIQASIM